MKNIFGTIKLGSVRVKLIVAFLTCTIVPIIIMWFLAYGGGQDRVGENGALLIMLLVVVIATILAIFMSNSIAHPIGELSKATYELAQGNLSATYEVTSTDEIGRLADSLTTMVGTLGFLLARAKVTSNQISSVSSQILAGSEQQAAGAAQQSSAIDETASAAEELSKSSEQISENAQLVKEAASHALAGMARIDEATGKTGERIASLSEKSQKIGKITGLIDDVADQTNLLAVNAAIEAARAGEQGRGFTVVADEIRKLSDSTAKSTKDITDLIEIIQHEVSDAVASMEESMASVQEEVKFAEESAEKAKEISMSATQQMSGSKQIAEAMRSINETMKQSTQATSQAKEGAKQLMELANELKDVTETYKL